MYPVVIFGPVLEPPHPTAFLSESPAVLYGRRGGVAPVPWISGFNADEGAINIAVLFGGNGTLEALNTQWDTYAPILLDLKDTEGAEDARKVAEVVRDHYFPSSAPITWENRDKAVEVKTKKTLF